MRINDKKVVPRPKTASGGVYEASAQQALDRSRDALAAHGSEGLWTLSASIASDQPRALTGTRLAQSPQFARFSAVAGKETPTLPPEIVELKLPAAVDAVGDLKEVLNGLLAQSAAANSLMRNPATESQGIAQFHALRAPYRGVFDAAGADASALMIQIKCEAGTQLVRAMLADRMELPDALLDKININKVQADDSMPPENRMALSVEIAWHLLGTEPAFSCAFAETSIAAHAAVGVSHADVAVALIRLARMHSALGDAGRSDATIARALALDPKVQLVEPTAPESKPRTHAPRPAPTTPSDRQRSTPVAPRLSFELPPATDLTLPDAPIHTPATAEQFAAELVALRKQSSAALRMLKTGIETKGVEMFRRMAIDHLSIFNSAGEGGVTKYLAGYQVVRALLSDCSALPDALLEHRLGVVMNESHLPAEDHATRDLMIAWQLAQTMPEFARSFAEVSVTVHSEMMMPKDLAAALARLCQIQAGVGDVDAARATLDRAVELDPRNAMAAELGALLL